MNELKWTKQNLGSFIHTRRTPKIMWRCEYDGDVWTLREGPRSIDGCKNWIVERYSQGIRTRFATMPTLQSAADVVVRFVNDR